MAAAGIEPDRTIAASSRIESAPLGDRDTQECRHECHRQESEAALATGEPERPHGAFTRIGTVMGVDSCGRPLILSMSVTSTARGRACSLAASQLSSHEPASRR
jgi:hypothetical protein